MTKKSLLNVGWSASRLILVISMLCLLASGTARGGWIGGSNSDWNTAANWSGGSFPAGDAIIDNTAGPGVFPVISANSAFTPVDVRIGTTGGTGRVDQTAGTAGTGNGNWMFLGYVGSNATYNLANTAGSGGTSRASPKAVAA